MILRFVLKGWYRDFYKEVTDKRLTGAVESGGVCFKNGVCVRSDDERMR